MLRDLAELWFKDNCPPLAPIHTFLQTIDTAIKRNQNCWFRFGFNTTKQRAAQLVYCYEDEFFVFALNERQADLLKLRETQVTWGLGASRMYSGLRGTAAATLAPPEILVSTTTRIAGRMAYETPYNHMLPYCVRMTWDRPDGPAIDMFHYPVAPLMPAGIIPFDFQLQAPNQRPVPPGLVPVFFALNTVPQNPSLAHPAMRTRALSDTQAVLVELRPPGRS